MISVLIRTHNDSRFLPEVLSMLHQQELQEEVEILCCDDHSTDSSRDIITADHAVRLISPPEGKYMPGKTLNHLVKHANGEIIVFNNGDAIPRHREYLRNLIAPLKNRQAEAVFANQIPRQDAWPLVRKDYERAFGDGSISAAWTGFFSEVSSGFRKETLVQHPFDEAFQYSEDAAWIHARGIKPVYVPDAIVEHSHNYTPREVTRRFTGEGIADRQMGKHCPSLLGILRKITAETIRDWIWLIRHRQWRWIPYAPFYRWNQKMSYYRGTKK